MEKPALEGQSATGVLIVEPELDVLKKEVQHYTQQLWSGATKMFELHLGEPIDQFRVWFEAAREQKIRNENAKLKKVVENLEMELAVERSVKLVESSKDAGKFEAETSGVKQAEFMADDLKVGSLIVVPADSDKMMVKELTIEVQDPDAEAVKGKAEEIPDQGIVDPRSALGL